MDAIVFYLFAALAVVAALGVISLRNPVHSALSLAVVFVSLAALYVLLSAPFIAAAQVMVYAGAILILFVFVIMLLSPGLDQGAGALERQPALAGVFGIALVLLLVVAGASAVLPTTRGTFTPEYLAQVGNVEAIGAALFTDFILPFELTSVLLLAAIVGVVVLAKKSRS
ncbi:MAG: NADH-quinone oxidoreductase subunit J [Chloroflexi bacterium]|nr:NADH-quinone oxidoreductase subunit J [Chloroflexota bacterium]